MHALTFPVELELTPRSQELLNTLTRWRDQPAPPAIGAPAAAHTASAQLAIGGTLGGGIFAGVSRGEDGQPDAPLILLPDRPKAKLTWTDAKAWAEGLGDGARLPTRFESALLYAHLRDQMNTDDYHWTNTPTSVGYVWAQYFYLGSQTSLRKSDELLAVAVRRFNPSAL